MFAVARIGKLDKEKIAQRILKARYIYPPLKRNFRSLVLVTGFILEVVRKWLRRLTKLRILKNECTEADLVSLDLKEPVFSIFSCHKSAMEVETLDNKVVPENPGKSKLQKDEHMRRIREASNKFLNVSVKLE